MKETNKTKQNKTKQNKTKQNKDTDTDEILGKIWCLIYTWRKEQGTTIQ